MHVCVLSLHKEPFRPFVRTSPGRTAVRCRAESNLDRSDGEIAELIITLDSEPATARLKMEPPSHLVDFLYEMLYLEPFVQVWKMLT